MANNNSDNSKLKLKQKNINQEQIISGFNQLRQEQRQLANKIVELETDVTEHKLVIEALQEVDQNRKCFRMIGGILVERTVNEVLPSLQKNKDLISQLIESLKSQVVSKGKEINEFMDKYNIQIRQESNQESDVKEEQKSSSNSVLVE